MTEFRDEAVCFRGEAFQLVSESKREDEKWDQCDRGCLLCLFLSLLYAGQTSISPDIRQHGGRDGEGGKGAGSGSWPLFLRAIVQPGHWLQEEKTLSIISHGKM